MSDHHVHIHPHGPYTGKGPQPGEYPVDHIVAYFEAANANGVLEVGFTEHLYRSAESEAAREVWWASNPRKDLRDLALAGMSATVCCRLNVMCKRSSTRPRGAAKGARTMSVPLTIVEPN